VVISSNDDNDDNDNNRSDLDNREKQLPGDSNYRPGNRQRDNRGKFKKARTE
jgi:hypothetical protein